MRNYIILNGKNSNEINGLLIQELPPISKPLIRTEVEEIDGRDGDIVTPLGYSAYDKELTIGLYKDFDVNEVAAYFNSEGTVIFSNEPDKYYYYQITAQIDFERLVRYRTATVTMHCQPFKYSATEQPITEDVSGTVSDEGTNLALENTAEAPFNTLDLKGNTSQQTYSGKNLVYTKGATDGGITATYNATTGTTTVSGTATRTYAVFGVNSSNIPAGTYTLSIQSAVSAGVGIGIRVDGGSRQATPISVGSTKVTFTTSGTITSYDIYLTGLTAGRSYSFSFQAQLEAGSSATSFEPYVGGIASPNPDYPQAVKVVTGENTVKIKSKNLAYAVTSTSQGVTFGYNEESGEVSFSGTASGTWATNSRNYDALTAGTYTISIDKPLPVAIGIGTWAYNDARTAWAIPAGSTSRTFTLDEAASGFDVYLTGLTTGTSYNGTVKLQFEKGSQASDFEPHQEQSYPISLGSIELCKIGDYQDYIWKDGDTWKVHKTVGKLLIGDYDWSAIGTSQSNKSRFQHNFTADVIKAFSNNSQITPYLLCESYTPRSATNTYSAIQGMGQTTGYIIIYDEELASGTGADFKSARADVPIYYALATPTDTEITNEALIEQLDDIYYHAHAYKGRTHITSSAATGNVPHIIAAEVGEDNESTITNAGNYLSKPKITVYGSGDISLYINDMHVLQITLGDEGYITIDTAQMEAYKDTLDNLKNRLVIGDYSNARLKPGANKIHFTGTVTKYVVENYSRWL